MNGELSTMTSQMLAMLPTQGSPLQGFTELSEFITLERIVRFRLNFQVYPSCFSSSTGSSLMSGLGSPLILLCTSKKFHRLFDESLS